MADVAQKITTNSFNLERTEGGIAFLTIDVPGEKVNILSSEVMAELDRLLDEIHSDKGIKALVFHSGKDDNFIAGANVREIEDITEPTEGAEKAHLGQMIFHKMNHLPFPVIAAIQGACVGGGLELALACHYRIAKSHPKTRIGLPEVKLGILPGFGGTQRLPRLIGIQSALKLILTGKLVSAETAGRIGIVDKVLPPDEDVFIKTEAESMMRQVLKRPGNYKNRSKLNFLKRIFIERNPLLRKLLFSQARKQVLRNTKGHYPAPLKALEAVEFGIGRSLLSGLQKEAALLGELISTGVSKNLIGIYHLTEDLKKDAGVEKAKKQPAEIKHVCVVGAGVMGGGIAQLMAHKNMPVTMKDINQEALDVGFARAQKIFKQAVDRRKMSADEMQRKMALIAGTLDYSGFADSNLVIEAVVEDLAIKKQLFSELEKEVEHATVLASNTSSLSVTEIASAANNPERVIGFHFFNPVHRMPLVEIIRGQKTSDQTTVTAVAFAKKIGKIPIVVKNSPGFLVNRILGPYINEATLLLEEGATIEKIDKAMLTFGMPMGPLNLLDEVGIDVGFKVAEILREGFGERVKPSSVISNMYKDGRLGKKGGKGFYLYKGKEKQVDASVYRLIKHRPSDEISQEEIQKRLIFIMLKEAVLCLEEEIVRRVRDVDAALIFGTGFPPFHGGLLKYADSLGLQKCAQIFEELENRYGNRFSMPKRLHELLKKEKTFYG